MEIQPVSSIYIHVRGRQLEGTYPGDTYEGIWPVTAARIHKGWGIPTEADWPYITGPEDWPPVEPQGIDALAKPRRTLVYQRVRDSEDCRQAIQAMRFVPAAFETTKQWDNAVGGLIEMPISDADLDGSHQVCIGGFDDDKKLFSFINSWGEGWGENGFGWLPYEYFDKYLVDAWTMRGVGERTPWHQNPVGPYINWGEADYRGHTLHVQEVFDFPTDEVQGWSFCVERDGFLDIEELYVRPQYRNQGIGCTLAEMIKELENNLNRPLRAWVPLGDYSADTSSRVDYFLGLLGLTAERAGVSWASHKAVANGEPADSPAELQPPKSLKPGSGKRKSQS